MTKPPDFATANLVGDNLRKWKATITGPEKSPYEKGIFTLDIEIPTEYPFKPPKVLFQTKIYHPNVKSDGSICMPILNEQWSPQIRISEILKELRNLLLTPNPDHALEAEIAQLYKTDINKFNKTAKEWTGKYAKEAK